MHGTHMTCMHMQGLHREANLGTAPKARLGSLKHYRQHTLCTKLLRPPARGGSVGTAMRPNDPHPLNKAEATEATTQKPRDVERKCPQG